MSSAFEKNAHKTYFSAIKGRNQLPEIGSVIDCGKASIQPNKDNQRGRGDEMERGLCALRQDLG